MTDQAKEQVRVNIAKGKFHKQKAVVNKLEQLIIKSTRDLQYAKSKLPHALEALEKAENRYLQQAAKLARKYFLEAHVMEMIKHVASALGTDITVFQEPKSRPRVDLRAAICIGCCSTGVGPQSIAYAVGYNHSSIYHYTSYRKALPSDKLLNSLAIEAAQQFVQTLDLQPQ